MVKTVRAIISAVLIVTAVTIMAPPAQANEHMGCQVCAALVGGGTPSCMDGQESGELICWNPCQHTSYDCAIV